MMLIYKFDFVVCKKKVKQKVIRGTHFAREINRKGGRIKQACNKGKQGLKKQGARLRRNLGNSVGAFSDQFGVVAHK